MIGVDRMTQLVKVIAYGTAAFVVLVAGGVALGQQPSGTAQTVMHVVAFTPNDGVTPEDLAALRSATAELVRAVPGMKQAWVGKLRQPLVVGSETRTHGLIFEFNDAQSRQAYTSHPGRVAWAKQWERVRKSGTNFDVIGSEN